LLSKNITIKMYRTVILLSFCMGVKLCFHTEGGTQAEGVRDHGAEVFGPMWDNVTGELYNEEIYYLYSSPYIIQVIKTSRMRWVGNVVWGREEVHTGFWWGNLWERDHSQDPGIDGRIILRRISRKWKRGGSLDRIDMAQDRDRWPGLVNAVMKLRVP
jgi:hypothetical protein